jgi:hypothetical protein
VGVPNTDPPAGANRLAAAFGELDQDDVAARISNLGLDPDASDRYVPELLVHLLSDPVAAASFVEHDPAAAGAFEPV